MIMCLVASAMNAEAKDYRYQTVSTDLMKTRIYTLDNGLKVYLSVNKEKPRIQANIAVRTGSRNDPAETTGLAHYLEHLMFKGTKLFGTTNPEAEAPLLDEIEQRYEKYRLLTDSVERRNAYRAIDSVSQVAARYFIPNEYDKLMSAIGSEGTNAYTSLDVTCYVENIPNNEVENWARIQADRFQNMVIRGFHTELEAVYEEYNIGLANDGEKEMNAMLAKLFPAHPYGTQTTIGTQDHLKNPSITNIKNYFNRYYVPNNVAVCMAGDFEPDEVIAVIDRYFGSWKPSKAVERPEYAPLAPVTAPTDTAVVGQEAENVLLAWRFKGAGEAQADTLGIIDGLLSNGKAGLLDINLEQTMKVQAAGAGAGTFSDYSIFELYGLPKEGQTLEEVRELLLGEIGKLRRGEFADELVSSVINNKKLNYYRSLERNDSRAGYMVDAFVNGQEWGDVVGLLDRQSRMTKQQLVDFANRHFTDNFICVYKRQGVDSTQKKIDKPAITAIPSNRDLSSAFLNEIKNTEVKPIEPRFLDFKNDLTVTRTKKKLPLLYKKNTDDGLFKIVFMYDFGQEDQLDMSYAADYLNYIGTDRKSITEIKQEFYKLACNYAVSVGDDYMTVELSGLNENMPVALGLLEDLLQNAKGDAASYEQYVDLLLKSRAEAKNNQRSNFRALTNYVQYGAYNPFRVNRSEQELRDFTPEHFTGLLKKLNSIEHTVMYYGPMTEKELDALLSKVHRTPKKLESVPVGREFALQTTPRNEVYIAPYDAKNIYLTQFHNDNRAWNDDEATVKAIFNEYFGGGMNGIVFQELREARGLAYSASAQYVTPRRLQTPEYFYTQIISQNDKMMDCIRTFNSIIDTLPQSKAAFDIAKQSLLKNYQSRRVTKFGILDSYYWSKKLGRDSELSEVIYQRLPSLTLDEMTEFEKERMAGKPYKYIILGDEQNLDIPALEKIGPVKRLSTEEIFGY